MKNEKFKPGVILAEIFGPGLEKDLTFEPQNVRTLAEFNKAMGELVLASQFERGISLRTVFHSGISYVPKSGKKSKKRKK